MEHTTLLTVTLIGIAGWLCSTLMVRSGAVDSPSAPGWGRASFLTTLLVPAAMIAAAQFGRQPVSTLWSIGLGLGSIGSLAAEYVSLLSRRRQMSLFRCAAAVAASPFAAIASVSGTLLWAKGPVEEALVTIPVAWVVVSLILASRRLRSGGPRESGAGTDAAVDAAQIIGPGFAVALGATTALGIYRGGETDALRWSVAAVTFAAAVPVSLLFGAAAATLVQRGNTRGAIAWHAIFSTGLLAGVSAMLAPRMFAPAPLLGLVAIGDGLGFGLWWLVADTGAAVADRFQPVSQMARFGMSVAVLLVLGAFMAAFSLSAGYGVGLMVLAAWLILAVAAESAGLALRAAPETLSADRAAVIVRLRALVALAVVLLLFRLITTRFEDDLRGVVLTDHFALVGFLAGAALPALLTGLLERAAPGEGAWGLIALILSLVVAGAVPGVMFAVWGAKVALAVVAGLALSVAAYPIADGATTAPGPDAGRRAVLVPLGWLGPLYALAVAAAFTAWLHPVAQIAGQSRADRARILSAALAVLIAAVIVWDIAGRIAARRRGAPRQEPSLQGGAG